jgi:hypothetical protein
VGLRCLVRIDYCVEFGSITHCLDICKRIIGGRFLGKTGAGLGTVISVCDDVALYCM